MTVIPLAAGDDTRGGLCPPHKSRQASHDAGFRGFRVDAPCRVQCPCPLAVVDAGPVDEDGGRYRKRRGAAAGTTHGQRVVSARWRERTVRDAAAARRCASRMPNADRSVSRGGPPALATSSAAVPAPP